MLITDKNNRGYVYVTLEDILSGIENIDDEKIKQELMILFKSETENDTVRISKRSNVYKALSKCIINGDEYIDADMLSRALTRSIYEFNHEMQDKLKKYFRMYMNNIENEKSNELLVHKILCDEKVIDYMREFDTFQDYEKYLINKRLNKKSVKELPKEKGRSYVIID